MHISPSSDFCNPSVHTNRYAGGIRILYVTTIDLPDGRATVPVEADCVWAFLARLSDGSRDWRGIIIRQPVP
jgi:hypothetical protein